MTAVSHYHEGDSTMTHDRRVCLCVDYVHEPPSVLISATGRCLLSLSLPTDRTPCTGLSDLGDSGRPRRSDRTRNGRLERAPTTPCPWRRCAAPRSPARCALASPHPYGQAAAAVRPAGPVRPPPRPGGQRDPCRARRRHPGRPVTAPGGV